MKPKRLKPIRRWAIIDAKGKMWRDGDYKATAYDLSEWKRCYKHLAPFRVARVEIREVVK